MDALEAGSVMNPWTRHPALVGLRVPGRFLPPPGAWPAEASLGLNYPDGFGTPAARFAANPRPLTRGWQAAEGPVPELLKPRRGPVPPPGDAADAVYLWLTEQATLRLEAVKSHLETGRPAPAQIAHRFGVKASRALSWIRALRKVRARGKDLVVPQPRPFEPKLVKIPKGVTYFISGTEQSPGEIEGAARLSEEHGGFGVGVEVSGCSSNCRLALEYVARRDVPLFVDSGAFPEFTCLLRGGEPDRCVIGDEEWVRRLGEYEDIAKRFRSKANLVAPDRIGDQAETERRLKAFGGLLAKSARDYKAWILLVAQAQKGGASRHAFWKRMRDVLVKRGVPKNRIVAALPMKERSASAAEVEAFSKHLGKDVARYHLLGIGPLSVREARGKPTFKQCLDAIRKHNPKAAVTCDSFMLKTGFGRGEPHFLAVAPKVYTYAQDIVRFAVMHEAFQRSYIGGELMENWIPLEGWGLDDVPDYTDAMGMVDFWLPASHRKQLADYLEAESNETGGFPWSKARTKQLVESAEEFLSTYVRPPGGPKWYELPWVEAWLDDRWARYLGAFFSARVKRDGMVMAWSRGDSSAMKQALPGADDRVDEVMFGMGVEVNVLFGREVAGREVCGLEGGC